MRVDLYFPKYNFARVFGCETLFDPTATGLINMDMQIYTKNSKTVKSQLSQKDIVNLFY